MSFCGQEVLDYNLVLFSPYRDLAIYLKDSRLKHLADFAWWTSLASHKRPHVTNGSDVIMWIAFDAMPDLC